jgi:hypothetical protein
LYGLFTEKMKQSQQARYGLFALAAIALLGFMCLSPTAATEPVWIQATINSAAGAKVYRLEVAATPAARATGLMGRTELKAKQGMLFLFPEAGDHAFWMKDTNLPLDMLFIDSEQRIVYIAHNVPPQRLEAQRSGAAIMAVIELLGGTAKRDSIHLGDRVTYALPPSLRID